MKLFIANISNRLKDEEVKQMLTQFGQVGSIKLVTDPQTGKRKGFGFVEMPVNAQALSAIAALHDKTVGGRTLSLSEATDNQSSQSNVTKQQVFKNDQSKGEIDGNHW